MPSMLPSQDLCNCSSSAWTAILLLLPTIFEQFPWATFLVKAYSSEQDREINKEKSLPDIGLII